MPQPPRWPTRSPVNLPPYAARSPRCSRCGSAPALADGRAGCCSRPAGTSTTRPSTAATCSRPTPGERRPGLAERRHALPLEARPLRRARGLRLPVRATEEIVEPPRAGRATAAPATVAVTNVADSPLAERGRPRPDHRRPARSSPYRPPRPTSPSWSRWPCSGPRWRPTRPRSTPTLRPGPRPRCAAAAGRPPTGVGRRGRRAARRDVRRRHRSRPADGHRARDRAQAGGDLPAAGARLLVRRPAARTHLGGHRGGDGGAGGRPRRSAAGPDGRARRRPRGPRGDHRGHRRRRGIRRGVRPPRPRARPARAVAPLGTIVPAQLVVEALARGSGSTPTTRAGWPRSPPPTQTRQRAATRRSTRRQETP